MGITGLIPFLKKSTRTVNLSEFKGCTAVVDAYCWLHKGAFSCADKLVKGEPTNGYVVYVMKQVNLLLSFNIKPILVFDGCHLPAKAVTEKKRREKRDINQRKAKELLRQGRLQEARECFQRCVDVTSKMAHDVIEACRARNIDTIVAPYEADAQLAFLNINNVADIVITEDSDLVVFGCKKTVLKMDGNGGALLIEKDKIFLSMNIPPDKYTFEKFQYMCILSGCDYLPSLSGIGLAKAFRFISVTSNPDIYNSLCRMPSHLKMSSLEVNIDYRKGFLRALNTFMHQLVFDPSDRCIKPLLPYPPDLRSEDLPYCGPLISHEKGLQIALGNIDVQTEKLVDLYDPQKYQRPIPKSSSWNTKDDLVTSHPSIWDKIYVPRSASKLNSPKVEEGAFSTFGKKKTIELKLPKRIVKEENTSEDVDAFDQDLSKLYSVSQVLPKEDEKPDENNLEKILKIDENASSTFLASTEVKDESNDMIITSEEKEADYTLPNFEIIFENSDKNCNLNLTDNTLDKCRSLISDVKTDESCDVKEVKSGSETHLDPDATCQNTSPIFASKRAKNPFAKKKDFGPPVKRNPFSALKNFTSKVESSIKVQTLIHSRYFASASNSVESKDKSSEVDAKNFSPPKDSTKCEPIKKFETAANPCQDDENIIDGADTDAKKNSDTLHSKNCKRKLDDIEEAELKISPSNKTPIRPSFEWGHAHKRKDLERSSNVCSSLPITPPDSQSLDEKENSSRLSKVVKESPNISKYFAGNNSSLSSRARQQSGSSTKTKKSFCRQPGLTKGAKSKQPSLQNFGFKRLD